MNQLLIETGKRKTILISISILLISLWSIYFEQSSKIEIDKIKLIRQIIRFFLTVGLLYSVYIGKNWARIILLILFSMAIILSIVAIVNIDADMLLKIPFFVMIFIYGISIYHYSFSRSFKEFFNYQKSKQ